MNNIKPFFKRAFAYLIDLFLILIVSSTLSSISFINTNKESYKETYDKYEEEYNQYTNYLNLLEESYKDKTVTEEEYTKLIETSKYQDVTSSKYEDTIISKEEYTQIIKDINKEFDKIASDYIYLLNKKGISNSIITIICTLLYFGIIQYFFKGQTIGKKILKLKVVSASNKKINILNYILRSLIVNSILLNTISTLFLAFASQSLYNNANNFIDGLTSLVETIIIFFVLTREDQRGLHDILFNTKVISTEENIEQIENKKIQKDKTDKIIDAKYQETKKVNKTKETKK